MDKEEYLQAKIVVAQYEKEQLTIPVVIKSVCWKCKEPIKYNENGLPNYRCECGAVEPQNVL